MVSARQLAEQALKMEPDRTGRSALTTPPAGALASDKSEEQMPLIQVLLIEGRSPGAKTALLRGLTDAAAQTLEVPQRTVRVILHEVPPAHWAVGGIPKSELED